MGSFELTGRDIVVRYTAPDKTLVVRSKDLPGSDEKTFADVHPSSTDIGQAITVDLLESSRNGTKVLLHVLLPHVTKAHEDCAITGTAILISDFNHVLGGAPPVRQEYDVRPLKGTAHGAK
jgi:hypothetical protein